MSEQEAREAPVAMDTDPTAGSHPSTDDIAQGRAGRGTDTGGDGTGVAGASTEPAGPTEQAGPAEAATPTGDAGSTTARDAAGSSAAGTATSDRTPLFPAGQSQELRSRWESIQVGFVDEPRAAVEQADSLVAEVMQTLATTFSRERSALEGQWSKGEDVSTEDLRQTLRRYRSFFDRLLSL